MIDVSVIMVNYNTADLISACIQSVLKQKNINLEIIVVDNASKDNSLAVLKKFGHSIQLIDNKINVGFGRANNQGFQRSSGKFIFLLNPDAVLMSEYDLEKLLNFMDKNTDVGVVGPRVMSNHKATQPQKIYPGQSHLKKPLETLPGKIAWIIGASMFIRREVYEKLNGFDEDYFLYGEEADLCLRMRRAGWSIGYFDGVTVEHIGRASERTSTKREYWLKKQAGMVLFYKKSYGIDEAKQLIARDIKKAKIRLFILKFFKNAEKQVRYEAILEVLLRASLLP